MFENTVIFKLYIRKSTMIPTLDSKAQFQSRMGIQPANYLIFLYLNTKAAYAVDKTAYAAITEQAIPRSGI